MPPERYRADSLAGLARPYAACAYISAAQAQLLARAEATPLSAVLPPRAGVPEQLDVFSAELELRSGLLKTLWTSLWEFVFLLAKYSQPADRADHFGRFGKLISCLTQLHAHNCATRGPADLTAEQLVFDPREHKRVLGQAGVGEKFVRGQHVIEMQLKELCDKEQLPLVFVERFELQTGPAGGDALPGARAPRRMFTSSSLRPQRPLRAIEARKNSWGGGGARPAPGLPAQASPLPKTSIEDCLQRAGAGADPTLSISTMLGGAEAEEELLEVVNPLSNSVVKVQLPRAAETPRPAHPQTVWVIGEAKKTRFLDPERPLTALFAARPPPPPTHSVCVIVHGLEGFGHDMRYFRSALRHICPGHCFYISEANEHCTHESLETMGFRLATEVKFFLKSLPAGEPFRLSFIGHSLGGLIVRAALPFMPELHRHLRGYFSLNSPHLGCVSGNLLVKAGLLFLAKLEKNKSIRQMTLEDKECFLGQLAQDGQLDRFETLVFVAAYRDGYVNFESAKVLARFDNGKGLAQGMARSLLGDLRRVRTVLKVSVHVPGLEVGMDKFIGRNAHIEALKNPLLQNIVWQQLKEYI